MEKKKKKEKGHKQTNSKHPAKDKTCKVLKSWKIFCLLHSWHQYLESIWRILLGKGKRTVWDGFLNNNVVKFTAPVFNSYTIYPKTKLGTMVVLCSIVWNQIILLELDFFSLHASGTISLHHSLDLSIEILIFQLINWSSTMVLSAARA